VHQVIRGVVLIHLGVISSVPHLPHLPASPASPHLPGIHFLVVLRGECGIFNQIIAAHGDPS
jgi:hypothetical protein